MAQEIRVGFCENGAGYGGAIISLAAFLEKIPPEFCPHIYTTLASKEYRALERLGKWCYTPPMSLLPEKWLKRRLVPFSSTIDNLCNLLPSALHFYRLFKRDCIDVVYLNNDVSSNLAAALGAKLAGLPIILHARGFNSNTKASQWTMRNLAHCIAVSTAVRDNVLKIGLESEKCTVIPEGLDLTMFHPQETDRALLEELGLSEGEPIITLVGGLVDWKGQDVLLDAAPCILAKYPEAHILLVGSAYGRDKRFAETIAARARAPELRSRVHLLGARNDVAAILAASTIVVHASTKPEPFGRTFLEGMALGKPVIASNEGGPLDVIEHEVDGLLIPPRDPDALARAILRLLGNRAFAAALSANAAVKARSFSIERHTAAICTLLGSTPLPRRRGQQRCPT